MLILTRKPGESLYIGDNVKVTVVEIKGNQVRVGIDAPSDLRIYREEIYEQIRDENRKAAEGVLLDNALDELSGGWKGMSQGGAGASRLGRKMGPAIQTQSPNLLLKKRSDAADPKERVNAGSQKGGGKKES